MVAVRAVVVALTGAAATWWLVAVARRRTVADRLRSVAPTNPRRLPRRLRVPLGRALDAAALTTTPEHAVEIWLLGAATAAIVGAGLAPAVGAVGAVAVLAGGPVALRLAGRRRARLVAAAVPEALERVGAELRAGGTVPTGVATLAAGGGPLAADFARVQSRVRLGASLPDALRAWARDRPGAGIEAAAGALALSASVGGRAAASLDALAGSLRDRLAVAAEARALSAQARYSAWVIGVGPAFYLVASAGIDPRSVRALLGTGAGRASAAAGVALEVLGVAWMRAIVHGTEAA